MADFTPGPWQKDGRTIKTERGIIAYCPVPQSGGVFDCQQNARLIAAAPDLLAALEFYVAICGNTAAVVDRQRAQEAWEKARAAISKASSEQRDGI